MKFNNESGPSQATEKSIPQAGQKTAFLREQWKRTRILIGSLLAEALPSGLPENQPKKTNKGPLTPK